jgi:hypothetical protein
LSDQPHRGSAGAWLFAAAVALTLGVVIAVVIVVTAAHNSVGPQPTIGRHQASIGNARFNRDANRCHLHPAHRRATFTDQSGSLLLGLSATIRGFTGRAQCEETRLAQDTGVSAVREDLGWATIEPKPGRFHWSSYDAVVRTATNAGLMILPVLDDAPAWAAPTSDSLPASPAAYAAFVAAAVRRYGPGGTFWRANPRLPARPAIWYELWNEPYYAIHNRDPGLYARLVKAAATAGRSANPAARFLIEADAFYTTPGGSVGDWIAGMYAAVPDLNRYFDVVAVHPYGGDPTIDTPDGDVTTLPALRLARDRQEFVAHGAADKPVWITEIGWSTCVGDSVCVSEAQQAAYLKSFLSLARTSWSSYVRAVFVYDLRDSAPAPADDVGAWFGLLGAKLSHKPAWQVLRDAATAAS